MRQDYQNHVQEQRYLNWERTCGAVLFFVTGLLFIGILIMSWASGQEVKWVIISINGQRVNLGW